MGQHGEIAGRYSSGIRRGVCAMPAAPPPTAAASVAPAPLPPAGTGRRCENCGAPLYGDHCFACGQPTKGLVRQFSSILGDFLDTVFNIDSRVLRTIGPLFARPGYLSLEYFAGRRVRYVTPMRLFLFLSLVAFFAIQGSVDIGDQNDGDAGSAIKIGAGDDDMARATTPAQVRKIADDAVRQLEDAKKQVANIPGAGVGMGVAQAKIRERAKERIAALETTDVARTHGKPVPDARPGKHRNFNFPVNGKPWDPKTNPFKLGWLPGPANASLNHRLGHARQVLESGNSEKPLWDAMFNVLPQTLIVLMPLFALMLKVAYWFKRRLYMEHLIVALHSHAFISLALVLVLGLKWLQDWVAPHAGGLNTVFGWAVALTALWIPVYLLLMQKRVYGQGWIMTVLKYFVLGVCYSVLLSIGLVAAVLVGLLTL
jgi:hypothetical protein